MITSDNVEITRVLYDTSSKDTSYVDVNIDFTLNGKRKKFKTRITKGLYWSRNNIKRSHFMAQIIEQENGK